MLNNLHQPVYLNWSKVNFVSILNMLSEIWRFNCVRKQEDITIHIVSRHKTALHNKISKCGLVIWLLTNAWDRWGQSEIVRGSCIFIWHNLFLWVCNNSNSGPSFTALTCSRHVLLQQGHFSQFFTTLLCFHPFPLPPWSMVTEHKLSSNLNSYFPAVTERQLWLN